MNKKGFTLVELLAVLVLMILVMLLIVPNLRNLMTSNKRKEYETYQDMMVEYTKTIPGYKNKSYVCLKDLKMQPINESITCNGYVLRDGNKLTPYLSCHNKTGELMYESGNYELPSDC